MGSENNWYIRRKLLIFVHSFDMSPTEKTKTEKNYNFQAWLKQTADVMLNADKMQLAEIQNRLQSLLKRNCSQSECESRDTKLYYCSNCKCTHPVCREHFKFVNQRLCLVCD